MGQKSRKSAQKSQKSVPSSWVDSIYSYIISTFRKVGNLDVAFVELGPSSYWRVLTLVEDERVCDKYKDWAFFFYKWNLSTLGLHLPFNSFAIEVLNHMAVAHLQLRPASWAYVKVNQYWCEYLKGKPFVTLFFRPFKCCYSLMAQGHNRGLISLYSTTCGFRPLLEL